MMNVWVGWDIMIIHDIYWRVCVYIMWICMVYDDFIDYIVYVWL